MANFTGPGPISSGQLKNFDLLVLGQAKKKVNAIRFFVFN